MLRFRLYLRRRFQDGIARVETQRFARLKVRGGGGARRINTVLELPEPPTLRRQNRVRVAKNFLQLRSAGGVVHVASCFGDSPAGAGQLLDVSGAGDDFDLVFGRWIDQSDIGVLLFSSSRSTSISCWLSVSS